MTTNFSIKPARNIYNGLFLTSLATIMLELLLTRIFSVTMWYHFAFMAISIAMFGLTIGAMVVYLYPKFFTLEKAGERLMLSAVLFCITIVLSFYIFLFIPIDATLSVKNLLSLSFIYILISIPFIFSGIIICFCLTRFPLHVNSLYAVDLIGAAIGGLSLILVLNLTNGPTGMLFVAFLGSICAISFSSLEKSKLISMYLCLFILLLTALNTLSNIMGEPVFALRWVKGNRDIPALYEKWNSFSRIIVFGNPDVRQQAYVWGLSPAFPDEFKYKYLEVQIDGGAITPLLYYRHNNDDISFLKHDISSIGYYAKPSSSVLVIGSGGGRDVLTALLFNAKSVLGIDINKNTLNAANKIFGEFTGHLDQDPRVTFVHDEARSYVTRSHQSFDFIQISLIDTWAATAAGAFVLSENSLYTTQAWAIFFNHLTNHGILSVSRWYSPEKPAEIYRLLSLANQSLIQMGVKDISSHIILINNPANSVRHNNGLATLLISKSPFTIEEISRLKNAATSMQFQILFLPNQKENPTPFSILTSQNNAAFIKNYIVDISAPTDNRPFFFEMLKWKNLASPQFWHDDLPVPSTATMLIFLILLAVSIILTFIFIIVPLAIRTRLHVLYRAKALFCYFALIGLGFMMIEISQMQKLSVFLGYPTYGLSIVLTTLLFSSGFGSMIVGKINAYSTRNLNYVYFSILLGMLIFYGVTMPALCYYFTSFNTLVRILVSAGMLLLLGLPLGVAFPCGMRLASQYKNELTPWLWGVNGAASVCSSIMTVLVSLSLGIHVAFWCGVVCYAFAGLSLMYTLRV